MAGLHSVLGPGPKLCDRKHCSRTRDNHKGKLRQQLAERTPLRDRSNCDQEAPHSCINHAFEPRSPVHPHVPHTDPTHAAPAPDHQETPHQSCSPAPADTGAAFTMRYRSGPWPVSRCQANENLIRSVVGLRGDAGGYARFTAGKAEGAGTRKRAVRQRLAASGNSLSGDAAENRFLEPGLKSTDNLGVHRF